MDFNTGFDPEMLKDKKESAWDFSNDIWFPLLLMIIMGSPAKDNHSFDKDYIQYLSGKLDAYKEILKGDI